MRVHTHAHTHTRAHTERSCEPVLPSQREKGALCFRLLTSCKPPLVWRPGPAFLFYLFIYFTPRPKDAGCWAKPLWCLRRLQLPKACTTVRRVLSPP